MLSRFLLQDMLWISFVVKAIITKLLASSAKEKFGDNDLRKGFQISC